LDAVGGRNFNDKARHVGEKRLGSFRSGCLVEDLFLVVRGGADGGGDGSGRGRRRLGGTGSSIRRSRRSPHDGNRFGGFIAIVIVVPNNIRRRRRLVIIIVIAEFAVGKSRGR